MHCWSIEEPCLRNIIIAGLATVPVYYCSSIPTSLTAPSLPFLSKIVLGKTHLEATTSRQRRDARPDSFQLLLQFRPHPILQLSPRIAFGESRRWCDLAIRHVLAVGFRSGAGAVYKRARSNFCPAGQELYDKTDGAVVVFAVVEFALAEARKRIRN